MADERMGTAIEQAIFRSIEDQVRVIRNFSPGAKLVLFTEHQPPNPYSLPILIWRQATLFPTDAN